MKVLVLITSLFIFVSCGADQLNQKSSDGATTNTVSPIGQSCNCTFEYSPVCSAGKTYDNSCIAKCNGVTTFSNGKCECNSQSGEVCAQPPMPTCPEGMVCAQVMPMPATYSSECEMLEAKAVFIRNGSCN